VKADAKQSVADGHATPAIPVTTLGTVWFDQDAPPFVVVKIRPDVLNPTAMQSLVDGHAIPVRYAPARSVLGRVWLTQVVPPLVVARTTPVRLVEEPSEPTAKQSLVDGHAIPARDHTLSGRA